MASRAWTTATRRPFRGTSRTRSSGSPPTSRRSIAGGAIPLGIGGDHSVTLAELRAAAAVHGPLGLVHLDSHHDVWDSLLRAPAEPRHGVPPRVRGGPARPVPLPAGGHARRAVLRRGLRVLDGARHGDRALERRSARSRPTSSASGRARGSATARRSSRSTSTSSTRRSARAPVRPRSGARPRRTPSICVRALRGHRLPRVRHRRGRSRVRRARPGDGAARGERHVRVPLARRARTLKGCDPVRTGRARPLKLRTATDDLGSVRRLLSPVVAACLERRPSSALTRVLCFWAPLAVAAATIAFPTAASLTLLVIPGALLAVAILPRGRAVLATAMASTAIAVGPIVSVARDQAGSGALDIARPRAGSWS